MEQTPEQLFERYVLAGPIGRDAEAVADLFTEDGLFEAPLLPPGHRLPRRLAGRAAIRAGIGAHQREPAFQGTVDPARSRYALHRTTDPDVFVVEIDAVVSHEGEERTHSLVQLFRLRGGRIAVLRDFFAPPG